MNHKRITYSWSKIRGSHQKEVIISRKWLLPKKLKPWFEATMSTKTFKKLKSAIKTSMLKANG